MVKDSATRILKLISVLLAGCLIVGAKAALIRLAVTIWAGALILRGVVALVKRDYKNVIMTLPAAAVSLIIVWSAAVTAPYVLMLLTIFSDIPEICSLRHFEKANLKDYALTAAEVVLSLGAIICLLIAFVTTGDPIWMFVLSGILYILKAVVELIRL